MGCSKISYDSRREAVRAMINMFRYGNVKGKVSVYRCRWCGFYHWGHEKPQTPAKLRR